ncbi:ATP-binding protein [Jeotgalibacillus proteolyticus]|uniref:histidine kinase n=1 Tax=Jeotgalibacillus proteolyticus TaxID=2082395 RepID=A0A2S5GD26_9BACL|nr:ATP-binding protein [Jeotgalibacillus proteolyticus]PPA70858.1 two-component sensor histidine kinase [Jeotgalibacillus proteolyticus]
MTEHLLINFLFLLFPVLIYLIFFEDRFTLYRSSTIFLALAAFPMLLSMSFPIKIDHGFIFDLRYVPFIIISLFMGYRVAIPLYLILNVYRFIIGGEGLLPSLLFSTAVLLAVPLWYKKFNQLNPRQKVLWSGLTSFMVVAFYLVTLTAFFPVLNREYWTIVFNVLPIHVIAVMTIVALIQKIILNVKNRERYLQSERLNVINELSASVSHEIRNPLTVTSGFMQLLNESKSIPPAEKSYIVYSIEELKRAEKIISDFLSFARPQAENMVTSNLKNELEYVNNLMIPYANQHLVDIRFLFSNELETQFDQHQLHQCLINLYKNGVEAMKEKGGTLTVEVSSKQNEISIVISDTGVGITDEDISLIGKPYYSTKKQGTGLGMVMVYSVIDKLKGKIEIESKKDVGTTFILTLPVKRRR